MLTKKKNLIFEGVTEVDGRRENVDKMVGAIFDQLNIAKGINYDACYRVGPYLKSRARPILVSFEKCADHDAIYSRKMDLKKTKDFQNIWVNEDLGPL